MSDTESLEGIRQREGSFESSIGYVPPSNASNASSRPPSSASNKSSIAVRKNRSSRKSSGADISASSFSPPQLTETLFPKRDFAYQIGTIVEAKDVAHTWYKSRIVQIDPAEGMLLIHFDKWNNRYDEWFKADSPNLRAFQGKLQQSGQGEDRPLEVGDFVHAKYVGVRYVAKIVKIDLEADRITVVFDDGLHKSLRGKDMKRMSKQDYDKIPNKDDFGKELQVAPQYKNMFFDPKIAERIKGKRKSSLRKSLDETLRPSISGQSFQSHSSDQDSSFDQVLPKIGTEIKEDVQNIDKDDDDKPLSVLKSGPGEKIPQKRKFEQETKTLRVNLVDLKDEEREKTSPIPKKAKLDEIVDKTVNLKEIETDSAEESKKTDLGSTDVGGKFEEETEQTIQDDVAVEMDTQIGENDGHIGQPADALQQKDQVIEKEEKKPAEKIADTNKTEDTIVLVDKVADQEDKVKTDAEHSSEGQEITEKPVFFVNIEDEDHSEQKGSNEKNVAAALEQKPDTPVVIVDSDSDIQVVDTTADDDSAVQATSSTTLASTLVPTAAGSDFVQNLINEHKSWIGRFEDKLVCTVCRSVYKDDTKKQFTSLVSRQLHLLKSRVHLHHKKVSHKRALKKLGITSESVAQKTPVAPAQSAYATVPQPITTQHTPAPSALDFAPVPVPSKRGRGRPWGALKLKPLPPAPTRMVTRKKGRNSESNEDDRSPSSKGRTPEIWERKSPLWKPAKSPKKGSLNKSIDAPTTSKAVSLPKSPDTQSTTAEESGKSDEFNVVFLSDESLMAMDKGLRDWFIGREAWLRLDPVNGLIFCAPCRACATSLKDRKTKLVSGLSRNSLVPIHAHEVSNQHRKKMLQWYTEYLKIPPPAYLFPTKSPALDGNTPVMKKEFPCNFEGCTRCFRTEQLMLAHYRHTHTQPEPLPESVKKRAIFEPVTLAELKHNSEGAAVQQEPKREQNDDAASEASMSTVSADMCETDIVRCTCSDYEEDGFMLQCERCQTWQHGECMRIRQDTVPSYYICHICNNPPGIRESQRYTEKTRKDLNEEGVLPQFTRCVKRPPPPQPGQSFSGTVPMTVRAPIMTRTRKLFGLCTQILDRITACERELRKANQACIPNPDGSVNEESETRSQQIKTEVMRIADSIEAEMDALEKHVEDNEREWTEVTHMPTCNSSLKSKATLKQLSLDLEKVEKLCRLSKT